MLFYCRSYNNNKKKGSQKFTKIVYIYISLGNNNEVYKYLGIKRAGQYWPFKGYNLPH